MIIMIFDSKMCRFAIPEEMVQSAQYREIESGRAQGLLHNQLINYYVLRRPVALSGPAPAPPGTSYPVLQEYIE